ncbi:hypothetical protein [Escherichia coli]|uniref:hypothetical protein n=1 Tax=Escherichia coli TaxID=562 RepID=UPI0013B05B61|nr:hypothetical protein [Escherichia coli]
MEKMFQILETAWPAVKTTGLTGCVTAPETEDNLLLFEDKYATHIPKDYRQLLSHFGACHFVDPQIGNDSNLLIVFYVQIMPDDFVMQLHRF